MDAGYVADKINQSINLIGTLNHFVDVVRIALNPKWKKE
jgi:hypothetical protein